MNNCAWELDFNAVPKGRHYVSAISLNLPAVDTADLNAYNVDANPACASAIGGVIAFRKAVKQVKPSNSGIAFPFLGF